MHGSQDTEHRSNHQKALERLLEASDYETESSVGKELVNEHFQQQEKQVQRSWGQKRE